MYMHVSCTPSDKYLAALERRMFLCDGLSPAVSDSHLLEACVTILRWWCFKTCSFLRPTLRQARLSLLGWNQQGGQISEAFFHNMWVLIDAFRTNFSGSGGSWNSPHPQISWGLLPGPGHLSFGWKLAQWEVHRPLPQTEESWPHLSRLYGSGGTVFHLDGVYKNCRPELHSLSLLLFQ